jgi:hypothetical protein
MYNYDPNANSNDDVDCIPFVCGCMDDTSANYDPFANSNNYEDCGNVSCECVDFVYGCMDPLANNYNPLATHDQKYTWNGDDSWDGTSAGVLSNYSLGTCDNCECNYDNLEILEMNVINNPDDSEGLTLYGAGSTNPWLLDPDITDSLEDFYENSID